MVVGAPVVVGAGASVVVAPLLGSRHWHTVQKLSHQPKSLLQQAPPSQLQSALLFSSSHNVSVAHWGYPHPVGGGGAAVVGGGAVVGPAGVPPHALG